MARNQLPRDIEESIVASLYRERDLWSASAHGGTLYSVECARRGLSIWVANGLAGMSVNTSEAGSFGGHVLLPLAGWRRRLMAAIDEAGFSKEADLARLRLQLAAPPPSYAPPPPSRDA